MFLIAALNELDVLSGDVGNAYLNVPCKKKVYVTLQGDIFGPKYKGRKVYITRSIYGLRYAGNAWYEHLCNSIHDNLGYKACLADPDVYVKHKISANGEPYWSYIVC